MRLQLAVDSNVLITQDIYNPLYPKQEWWGISKKKKRTGFSPNISVFPWQYNSSNATHSSSSTYCSYQTDKRAKHGSLQKSNALSEIGQHWIEKCCYFSLQRVKQSRESD